MQILMELQLKGSGLTSCSRDGDGRAVLRPTVREYLCSEVYRPPVAWGDEYRQHVDPGPDPGLWPFWFSRCLRPRVHLRYVLRNYLVQQAIEQAEQRDHGEIDRLLVLLWRPFEDQPGMQAYAS